MRKAIRFQQVITSCAVLLSMTALAGCSQDPTAGLEAFESPHSADDKLPEAVLAGSSLDWTSSRFLATEDRASYFLATDDDDPSAICLVIYASPEAWVIGCSEGFPASTSVRNYEATVTVGTEPPSGDGWTRLDRNVAVRSHN